ncbi:MAG: chemotaxis protein CheB [Myxococcaceae bacterium]|nr:chemotaxis protein CheB [Myxococcaceae bacterium]
MTCRVLIIERTGRVSKNARALYQGGVVEAAPPADPALMLEQVQRHAPDVVVVDLEDAPLEAVAAIETVMAERPVPVVVVTDGRAQKQHAIRALAAGALEIAALDGPDAWRALQRQVLFLAKVPVVKHVKGRKRKPRGSTAPAGHPVVAVAASLGGPKALARLIGALPQDFAAPMVLCQHITPGFADDLARYLAVETRHDVVEAGQGMKLEPARFYVAPSEAHLLVRPDAVLELDPGPAVGGFRPSCDVLLKSVANAFGARAIGVVLTGMGRDGARGLKEIRGKGGHTIAQDQATSVVFGMPGESIALGGAEVVLPLDQIAGQLVKWVMP